MKKPPTPKQIIEGKEPNELTDLLEMEAPKEPLEKAWEDLKEATEKWNKEALKAMGETKEECRCEKDGFLGAVWRGDCPIHKDETPTENINETNQSVVIGENITTKENWIEELYKIWNDKTTLIEISEFIAQLLLTQRQEIEKWISENEYCSRCSSPKKFCKMWGTSPSAIDTEDLLRFLDLSERIEKGA